MKTNIFVNSLKELRVLLISLLCLWAAQLHALVTIPLNDPNLYYDGVFHHSVSASVVHFNRHTPAAYAEASSGLVYYPCNLTRNTQTGIRVRFRTNSPHVYMSFAAIAANGYYAVTNPTNGFTVFANGVNIGSFSTTTFTINAPSSGTIEYEVTLPNLWSVDFTGMQLDDGYSLASAGANTKPRYAAFGTSITHGTGQFVNTVKTYAFKLAQNKGWNLHNFAVAGSPLGYQISYSVKNQPPIDYITIEHGFNDWASAYAEPLPTVQTKYARLIDSLRLYQPTAKIYCIAPIVTTYVPSAPLYTLDQFRSMVSGLVDTRKTAGDNKIFFINGADISTTSMLSAGVHLSESGASQLADELIALIEPSSVSTPGFFAANNSNFQYSGRIDFTNPRRPGFSFPGVSVKTVFEGSSLSVVIKEYGAGTATTTNYFNVIVDGTVHKLAVNGADTLYNIPLTLSDGEHSLEIVKRTEASVGKCEFRGIVITPGKELKPAPAKPALRIEFIGDSYTCGYGNERYGDPVPVGFNSTNENNYLAWGALTARQLNMEYHCTAASGRGVYRNNSNTTTGTVPMIYDQIIPDQVSPAWNKDLFTPDVMVIHLGTNDFYPERLGHPLDSTNFVNAYIAFVNKLRGYYPTACIILTVPNGLSDWYPSNAKTLTRAKRWIKAAKDHFTVLGDNQVFYFVMTPQDVPYGEDWHPSVLTHQVMKNDLVNFLQGINCSEVLSIDESNQPFVTSNSTLGIEVFPTLVDEYVTVRIKTLESGDVKISVHSVKNEELKTLDEKKQSGMQEYKISLADLKAGMYFVSVQTSKGIEYKRICKL